MKQISKKNALKRLEEISANFHQNLYNTINFEIRVPDSIIFHEFDNAILTQKNLIENNPDDIETLNYLDKESKIINALPEIVHPMTIIYAITHFEVMLAEMCRVLYLFFPKSLINKEKSISYEQFFLYSNYEGILNSLIDQEIDQFSFKSIKQRINYLEKKFNLEFDYEKQNLISKNRKCIEFKDLIEIHSTRNILVHNNGVINKFYISENPDFKSQIGRKKEINHKYSMHALFVLFRVSFSFNNAIRDKINSKKVRHIASAKIEETQNTLK